MRKVIIGIVVVAVVALAFWWVKKSKTSDTPATPMLPHAGSNVQASRVEPVTSCPAARSFFTSGRPMAPVAPATNTLTSPPPSGPRATSSRAGGW